MNTDSTHTDVATPPPEPETAPIVAITAPPIDTVGELRRQHSVLIQRDTAGAGTAKPSPEELLGFLTSAQKLGRHLEISDDRETAQNIMDFWAAALLSQAPHLADDTRPFTLESLDERSHGFTSEAHQRHLEAVEVTRRAEKMFSGEQDGAFEKAKVSWIYDLPRRLWPWARRLAGRGSRASVMERLLLRFIRLKEKSSTEAYPVPVTSGDDIFRELKAHDVLEHLLTAGIIVHQQTAEGAAPSYILAHETLLAKWSILIDIVKRRCAFRQLAYGWNNSGRQAHALLEGGDQLEEALDYPHLDDVEQAFVEASRRAGDRYRRMILGFLSLMAALLFSLAGWLWKSNSELKTAKANLENKSYTLEKAIKDLNAKTEELKATNAQVEKQRDEIKDLNADLKRWGEEKEEAFKISETKMSQLCSLNEQLATRPNIPDSVKELLKHAVNPSKANEPNARGNVEIFVSLAANKRAMARANAYAAALRNEGFDIPAGVPLPRRSAGIYSSITEVRYFHDTDEERKLAYNVRDILIRAGIPSKKIRPVLIKDRTAPKRFIQISISNTGLP